MRALSMKVRLPTPLSDIAGKEEVELEGETVREVLARLWEAYPKMKVKLCDERGQLRRFVNVYVNGEDVRGKEGEGTKVRDGDEVSLMLAISGG